MNVSIKKFYPNQSEALLIVSKKIGLEVNAKTKNTIMSRDQNTGRK
jgi:hypothetical protein